MNTAAAIVRFHTLHVCTGGIQVLVAVAFQIYVALVKARVLFPDHGRSRSSAKVREPIDSGSSAADATDTGDVTAAVVDGKKVPVMFLSQRQRQKLGLKNVFDDAEALKQRRLAGVSVYVCRVARSTTIASPASA